MNFRKLSLVFSFAMAPICLAEAPQATLAPVPAAIDSPAPLDAKPSGILSGRPDAKVVVDEALGAEFRSVAAGIAFKPPVGGREVRRAVGGDEIVEFVYDKEKWKLKVSRLVFSKPVPLITDTEKDKSGIIRQGLIETMAEQLKVDTGGAEILRQDPINIIETPVGMIAARFNLGADTWLTQRALVQGDDKENLYYILDFTTPAPRTGPLEQDPKSKRMVELFSHIVESIQLLDQAQLIRDQNNRLYFTKALYVNITEPKMRGALVPERWLRLIRDGKDIGYSYVVEEVASGLPRKGESPSPVVKPANASGVRVGVRSRTFPDSGVQVDAESWSWVAMDKKQEEWSHVLVVDNANVTDPKLKKTVSTESGVAIWRVKPVAAPMAQNPGNPGIRISEDYQLNVTTGGGDPINKDLPPFYLPRTLDHLLPRLLPRGQEKGFMFATYVSDQKEVIRRYIDAGKEGDFVLNGKTVHAYPVRDRIGLEGSVTTHYVSSTGQYLGSINVDSKVTILPTDAASLQKMWKNVNLTRPGEVEAPVIPLDKKQ